MPNAVTANQLRWAAERADGTRDTDFALVLDDKEGVTLVTSGDPRYAASALHVCTPSEGSALQPPVDIEVTHDGDPVPDTDGADSMFLTQSAVEKFVLPYYTRFKSPAAVQGLKNKLFVDDVVIVMHFPPSITIGLTPVMRAYRKAPGRRLAPDSLFMDDINPDTGPADTQSVIPDQPRAVVGASAPVVTANMLRWAAERADGMRDTDLALITDPAEGVTVVPKSDARYPQAIAYVRTPTNGNALHPGTTVKVSRKGKPIDVHGADSMFLTQSSVEKFVLPYYMRFKDPTWVADLKKQLFSPDVAVVVHFPPSITLGLQVLRTYDRNLDQTGEIDLK